MSASSSQSANDVSRDGNTCTPSLLKALLYAACIVMPVSLVIAVTSLKPDAFFAPVGEPRVATAAEQRAILIAFVEHQQSTERSPTFDVNRVQYRPALENVTLSICGKGQQSDERCSELLPESDEDFEKSRNRPRLIDRNLSNKLVDALRRFNVGRQPLDTRSVPGIVPVDRERITTMFEAARKNRPNLYGSPPDIYQTYLRAGGILRVSRPVVSARGDLALLYVSTTYAPSEKNDQMELFAFQQGQWKFVGVVGYSQSTVS